MSFWSCGVGIWSHSCLIWVSSCWRVRGRLWRIFRLMMGHMFSIGERSGLQAGQFSTRTLLLWSHAVVIAAVCGFALSCWNTHCLEGSICCSKTFVYLSAFIVAFQNMQAAHTIFTYAPPYHQRCWLLNWTLKRWWHAVDDDICKTFCNLTLRNVVFKVIHNLFTDSFTDWRASAHLYFWETLPL